jgi:HD-like signal output (HDOD) protein
MGFWTWLFGETRETPDRGYRTRQGGSGYGSRAANPSAVATLEPADAAAAERAEAADRPWWAPEGASLVEPAPVERPDLSTEARALEGMLISHFDGHDLNMPPLPRVVERVLGRLADPKSGLSKVADDIAEDQVIAAAVLRMTNSPLYRGLHKITALRPAAARLGVKALRTLMMHESVRAAMFRGAGKGSELARMLWRCAFAAACIMRELSRFTTVDEEDAFLIGLLHDIGSVIVLRIAQTQKQHTGYEVDVDTFDYLCYECHQEFGELVAEQWHLPETLKTLIADHHTYPSSDDPLRIERLQLQVTDMVTAMLGYAPSASYDLREARAVIELGLADRGDFVAFLDELPERVEEVLDIF